MGYVLLEGPSTPAAATMGSSLNTGLTSSITGANIIQEFVAILPWVGTMVAAAFVIYEARKMIKGASKGKVRV